MPIISRAHKKVRKSTTKVQMDYINFEAVPDIPIEMVTLDTGAATGSGGYVVLPDMHGLVPASEDHSTLINFSPDM